MRRRPGLAASLARSSTVVHSLARSLQNPACARNTSRLGFVGWRWRCVARWGGRPARRAKRRRASEASLRWLRAFRRSEFHPLRLGEVVDPRLVSGGRRSRPVVRVSNFIRPAQRCCNPPPRLVSVASCFARRILPALLLSVMRAASRSCPFSSESYIPPLGVYS